MVLLNFELDDFYQDFNITASTGLFDFLSPTGNDLPSDTDFMEDWIVEPEYNLLPVDETRHEIAKDNDQPLSIKDEKMIELCNSERVKSQCNVESIAESNHDKPTGEQNGEGINADEKYETGTSKVKLESSEVSIELEMKNVGLNTTSECISSSPNNLNELETKAIDETHPQDKEDGNYGVVSVIYNRIEVEGGSISNDKCVEEGEIVQSESENSDNGSEGNPSSSSSSSLSSSSSSSSSSEEEKGKGKLKAPEIGTMYSSDDEDTVTATKGMKKLEIEPELPPVPVVDATLEPHHQLLPVGKVISMIGTKVVIEGFEKHRPLNEGSILWISKRRSPLGFVDEIFGPVKNPYYIVRYNEENEVPSGVCEGTAVSFVPEFANHVLNDPSLFRKGYDASGENDEELSDEVEFSDDEKEVEYQRSKRMSKRNATNQQQGRSDFISKDKKGHLKGKFKTNVPNQVAQASQALSSLCSTHEGQSASVQTAVISTMPTTLPTGQAQLNFGIQFPPQQLHMHPNASWTHVVPNPMQSTTQYHNLPYGPAFLGSSSVVQFQSPWNAGVNVPMGLPPMMFMPGLNQTPFSGQGLLYPGNIGGVGQVMHPSGNTVGHFSSSQQERSPGRGNPRRHVRGRGFFLRGKGRQ